MFYRGKLFVLELWARNTLVLLRKVVIFEALGLGSISFTKDSFVFLELCAWKTLVLPGHMYFLKLWSWKTCVLVKKNMCSGALGMEHICLTKESFVVGSSGLGKQLFY